MVASLCTIHLPRLHGWHDVLSEICSKALQAFTWSYIEPGYPCPESIPFGRTAEQGSSSSLIWMTEARSIQRRHTVSHKHGCSRDKETVMEQYYHHIHSHTYCILSLSAMWAGKSGAYTNRGIYSWQCENNLNIINSALGPN